MIPGGQEIGSSARDVEPKPRRSETMGDDQISEEMKDLPDGTLHMWAAALSTFWHSNKKYRHHGQE
eukprot:15772-Hanusia_phi.AAC.1